MRGEDVNVDLVEEEIDHMATHGLIPQLGDIATGKAIRMQLKLRIICGCIGHRDETMCREYTSSIGEIMATEGVYLAKSEGTPQRDDLTRRAAYHHMGPHLEGPKIQEIIGKTVIFSTLMDANVEHALEEFGPKPKTNTGKYYLQRTLNLIDQMAKDGESNGKPAVWMESNRAMFEKILWMAIDVGRNKGRKIGPLRK